MNDLPLLLLDFVLQRFNGARTLRVIYDQRNSLPCEGLDIEVVRCRLGGDLLLRGRGSWGLLLDRRLLSRDSGLGGHSVDSTKLKVQSTI